MPQALPSLRHFTNGSAENLGTRLSDGHWSTIAEPAIACRNHRRSFNRAARITIKFLPSSAPFGGPCFQHFSISVFTFFPRDRLRCTPPTSDLCLLSSEPGSLLPAPCSRRRAPCSVLHASRWPVRLAPPRSHLRTPSQPFPSTARNPASTSRPPPVTTTVLHLRARPPRPPKPGDPTPAHSARRSFPLL